MNNQDSQSEKYIKITPETVIHECNCNDKKIIRVVHDGGFGDKFIAEYCQKCYERESKEFMISTEVIS